MKLIAIDPGSSKSGYVLMEDNLTILAKGKIDNKELVQFLQNVLWDEMAIEVPKPRGGKMWRQLVETAVWIGRFIECTKKPFHPVDRKDVKMHICNSVKAKDGDIRQALIKRWGGKEKAIGLKATPGPLYGMAADMWQALGVGITYLEGGCKSTFDL